MPSADILQIPAEELLPKRDRLFRAAITGYCSITRPTARDAAQLDDLTLPLLPLVSDESRRYAAAALSEADPAPPGLLRRLADYPVAVSAPLLVRSRSLADIDLIGLIGRNGVAHARAISRRAGLNPNIAALVRALGVQPVAETPTVTAVAEAENSSPAAARPISQPGAAEEEMREHLRAMMAPAAEAAPAAVPLRRVSTRTDWVAAHAAYPRMVATGLSGVAALFQTAIADAFDLPFDRACEIVEDGEKLAAALKAAGFATAEAFFVAALAFPPRFTATTAIRAFVDGYRRLDVEEARNLVSSWRADAPRVAYEPEIPPPANADEQPRDAAPALRKAS